MCLSLHLLCCFCPPVLASASLCLYICLSVCDSRTCLPWPSPPAPWSPPHPCLCTSILSVRILWDFGVWSAGAWSGGGGTQRGRGLRSNVLPATASGTLCGCPLAAAFPVLPNPRLLHLPHAPRNEVLPSPALRLSFLASARGGTPDPQFLHGSPRALSRGLAVTTPWNSSGGTRDVPWGRVGAMPRSPVSSTQCGTQPPTHPAVQNRHSNTEDADTPPWGGR